ncbi:MAG: TIGR04283 family arsenosugar biosynthesis glycosyltransferase [Pseudonocardia sp.]
MQFEGGEGVGVGVRVAVVVPVLDEEACIVGCLRRLRGDFPDCVLVVVDGGSTDRTVELAAAHATVVHSPRGRARQMNAGAAAVTADVLWFVHADCTVAPEALVQIRAALGDPRVVGGGLRIRFDRRTPGLEFLRVTSNWRARVLGQVFGDQAMFVRRSVFDALGGFPEMPLMEDYEMSRRLRGRGRLVVLDAATTASSRRILAHGPWRMTVLMQWLKLQYVAGVDPERIRRRYERGTRRGRRTGVREP